MFLFRAVNILCTEKDRIIADFQAVKDIIFDNAELLTEKEKLHDELNMVAVLMEKCIAENARVAQNQDEYNKRYKSLAERFECAKLRLSEVENAILEKQTHREMTEQFLFELQKHEVVTEFDEGLWLSLVDFVTVYSKDDVRVTFKNGTEIKG